MPIICDIALKKGIRPERPCGIASISSQIGITCSPIAAAVVAFMTISNANGYEITIPQILLVSIPASLFGITMASIWSYHRGLDLDKDPQFQAKLKDPAQYNYIYGSSATTLDKKISKEEKISVYIFLIALGLIVIFAVFPSLLPLYTNSEGLPTRLKMNLVIQIVMLGAAALMVICAKANPKLAVSGAVWQSGMVAVVAIFGIAWMADTYFEAYTENIKVIMSGLVESYPWSIAFVFFFVSVLINSQGAVVVSMLPLAYSMGIDGVVLLGVFPSVYGYFFIPNYPSDIATVNFDRSGTTVIGKYLFNHSFMIPGLINVITATIVASILAQIFHGFGWV
jgi:anaerobic C4-dicarboxylate transporter DcuB